MKNTRPILFIFFFVLILSSEVHTGTATRVAILPFQINSPENLNYLKNGISNMLASRIAAQGGVIVAEDALVNQALAQLPEGPFSENTLKDLGDQLGVNFLIYGSLTKLGDNLSIDAKLFGVGNDTSIAPFFVTCQGMDNLIPKMDQFASRLHARIMGREPPQPSHPPSFAPPSAPSPPSSPSILGSPPSDSGSAFVMAKKEAEFWKSQSLPIEIMGMDIGDVDGDGKNETVVMGRQRIDIYRYSDDRLVLKKSIQGRRLDNYLSLDVADTNGNGVAEIFVGNLVSERLGSFVIEFQGGKYARIVTDQNYFFRVIRTTRDGQLLIGQKMGLDRTLYGSIYNLVLRSGRFIERGKMPLPENTIVCGFNLIDVDKKGEEEIVLVDNNDHLRVLSSSGELLWKSEEIYGGTKDFLRTYPSGLEEPDQMLEQRFYLQNRILYRNQNKGSEVILLKNTCSAGKLFARQRFYSEGEVFSLVWDGLGLRENWRTKKIHGYSADFQIKDIDNDGRDELVVGMMGTSTRPLFGKKRAYILSYELL